jgi:bifunctional non-homologous end joining protein LigD
MVDFDGEDIRREPWEDRKARLAKLLAKQPDGIAYNDHTDLPGQAVYEAACKMGLEGIISKRRDLPYRSGKCSRWRKIRNPKAPANMRIAEEIWS